MQEVQTPNNFTSVALRFWDKPKILRIFFIAWHVHTHTNEEIHELDVILKVAVERVFEKVRDRCIAPVKRWSEMQHKEDNFSYFMFDADSLNCTHLFENMLFRAALRKKSALLDFHNFRDIGFEIREAVSATTHVPVDYTVRVRLVRFMPPVVFSREDVKRWQNG